MGADWLFGVCRSAGNLKKSSLDEVPSYTTRFYWRRTWKRGTLWTIQSVTSFFNQLSLGNFMCQCYRLFSYWYAYGGIFRNRNTHPTTKTSTRYRFLWGANYFFYVYFRKLLFYKWGATVLFLHIHTSKLWFLPWFCLVGTFFSEVTVIFNHFLNNFYIPLYF